jgi:electron transport complex protein RnfD
MANFVVSGTPHVRSKESIQSIMRDVIIALVPATAAGIYYFGINALILVIAAIASAVAFEAICQKVVKKPVTVSDLSAVVTGLLLAMNLPAAAPVWVAIVGSAFAIIFGKQLFGGLGQNFVNPAATARVVLLVSFPAAMSRWVAPFCYKTSSAVDAVTTATPLTQLAKGEEVSNLRLFLGDHGGCTGETCVLALLIGFVYLLVRRVISPVIPLTFIGTVALFTLLLGGDPLAAMMTGGVMIGAIFMATDYTTSPVTPAGRWIFGIGCGLITVIIRQFGALSEGVSYAIVLMNILVPHIEDLTRPKAFGTVKKGGKAA